MSPRSHMRHLPPSNLPSPSAALFYLGPPVLPYMHGPSLSSHLHPVELAQVGLDPPQLPRHLPRVQRRHHGARLRVVRLVALQAPRVLPPSQHINHANQSLIPSWGGLRLPKISHDSPQYPVDHKQESGVFSSCCCSSSPPPPPLLLLLSPPARRRRHPRHCCRIQALHPRRSPALHSTPHHHQPAAHQHSQACTQPPPPTCPGSNGRPATHTLPLSAV